MKKIIITVFLLTSFYNSILPCLWDHDTVEMENRQFPEALDLISGKFLRHSGEFYRWRIKNREALLKKDRKAEYYDDLSVAYEKTGNTKKAIKIAQATLRKHPNRYETLANLGTFYIHNSQFKKGLRYLKRAVKINPNAHFGRENIQIALVEYLILKHYKSPKDLPITKSFKDIDIEMNQAYGFSEYVLKRKITLDAAIKGVLGMMKFGNFNSPVLLEALGDLLAQKESFQLSAMSYLQAANIVREPSLKKLYHAMAKEVVLIQVVNGESDDDEKKLNYLIDILKNKNLQAVRFYQSIAGHERKWIKQGLNPEVQFDKLYYKK